MRVAITGANGFLGRHLAAALVADGVEVAALSLERGPLPEKVAFDGLDIRDGEKVARAIERTQPDAVVHLAALSHVGESWHRIADCWSINVIGTENVVRAAAGRRLIFSSSAEVYGAVPAAEQPIGEGRPPEPRSPYAMSKAFAERIVLAAGGIVVRSFNLLGAGQLPTFALPSFAAQLAEISLGRREPRIAVGNLEPRRDFVDVQDAVTAYRLVLDRGEVGSIYNLASGVAPTIAEMLDRLIGVAGVAAEIAVDPERVRPVDVPELRGDGRRLTQLGWSPAPGGLDRALRALWQEALERARNSG